MYLTFYPSNRDRFLATLAFISSAIGALTPVYLQLGRPFSMSLFLMTLMVLILGSWFTFYFLRFHLCPVLQMYKESVIISRFQRKSISVKDIQLFSIERNKVKIQYVDNGKVKEAKVYILNESGNNWVLIRNGKISF